MTETPLSVGTTFPGGPFFDSHRSLLSVVVDFGGQVLGIP